MNGFSSRSLPGRQDPPAHRPAPRRAAGAGVRRWLRAAVATVGRWGLRRTVIRAAAAATGLVLLYLAFIWVTLPDISDPRTLLAAQSSVIVDRNGTELYRLYSEENRTFIPKEEIPEHLKHAIIAIEDERFYERGCMDWQAIGRAVAGLGSSGGASTLTRQLARNALDLHGENIVTRKLKEFVLGCQLERKNSKEDVLAMYLNWIPFGSNAYGVEQASQTYFSVRAKDLSLAQSAVLAALPQRPSYFNPYGRRVRTQVSDDAQADILAGRTESAQDLDEEDVAIGLLGNTVGTGSTAFYVGGRTDQVLRNMQTLGFITETERLQALSDLERMTFTPSRENIRAPHFVLWIRDQVQRLLPSGSDSDLLEQGGLTIETTLDWNLQKAAEDVVSFHKDDFAKRFNAHNIALLSLDPRTGEVLAYVGNSDFSEEVRDTKVDMVRAPRQPGSSFKPLVYAAAFEKGYSPGTVLHDVPTSFGGDDPQNFDGEFWGVVTARKALGASRNIPAVKAFFLAGGEENVLGMATRLGASTPEQSRRAMRAKNPDYGYGWPLAIGAAETPLLEMTAAYATLANGGAPRAVISLKKVTDKNGAVLFEAKPQDAVQPVIDPRIAYQITSVLSDESARPNEYWKQVLTVPGYQTAAKTGTSNKCLERQANGNCTKRRPESLWTMGYTPGLVTGVWVGNSDSEALGEKAESLSAAAPLWKEYMLRAHRALKNVPVAFVQPEGLVQLQISTLSGQLPSACTPVDRRAADLFLAEQIPTEEDTACGLLTVDKVTGLLASPSCPKDAEEERAFFLPVAAGGQRWPSWQQGLTAWAQEQQKAWDAHPTHSGSLLPLPLAPTGVCDPALTPGRLEKPTVQILFPQQGGTATFPAFRPKVQTSAGSAVREVVWTVDGRTVARWGSGSTLQEDIALPRSMKKDTETHTLGVTLIDTYFNKAEDSVTFRFEDDTTAPSVRWLNPPAAVRKGGILRLRAEAQDDGSGVKYVQFFLGNTLLSTRPDSPYELEYTVKDDPAAYPLKAKATDNAGNVSEDSVELTVTP